METSEEKTLAMAVLTSVVSAMLITVSLSWAYAQHSESEFVKWCNRSHAAVYVGIDYDDHKVLYCEAQDGTVLYTKRGR